MSSQKVERRYVNEMNVEYRAVSDEEDAPKKPIIRGYAAVYGIWSDELGFFKEKIAPGAFKEVLDQDTRALWNHNPDYVLGRTTNGTLKLSEDKTGLYYEVEPPDTQWARDLLTSIDRGDVTQNSFGFIVGDDEWRESPEEGVTRTITKVHELLDVSPVTYPAYPDATIHARSIYERAKQNGQIAGVEIDSEGGDNIEDEIVLRQRLKVREDEADLDEELTQYWKREELI